MDQTAQRNRLLRYASLLMVVAAGVRAAYAGAFEANQIQATPHWAWLWAAGYVVFVGAYALTPQNGAVSRLRIGLLAAQSLSALYLVWLYPSFIVTVLVVVVVWQVAWFTSLRLALGLALIQSVALAAIKCSGQADANAILILMSACGFQVFAVCAGHLAQGEAAARDRLAQANAELQATHALLTESARLAERLRISRDLHDVLGHNLTSLTLQLDVAGRLATGPAVAHLQSAREISTALLDQVRGVVSRVRVQPVDLRSALAALIEGVGELRVRMVLPDDLSALDPARADAILRCVQELVTNTLRHAHAQELMIRLDQAVDGAVAVTAQDDGQGGAFVEGQGLTGMRERFEMLGGSLAFASREGRGFTVHGAMPAAGAYP